jgi:CRP-like cAMP-binding protein
MVRAQPRNRASPTPALSRLDALSPLDDRSKVAIVDAASLSYPVMARRELQTENKAIRSPLLLLDGWAARVRVLQDGRRQFISFVLPGDILGHYGFSSPVATSTVVTLTDVQVCPLPESAGFPILERAYSISCAMDEACLVAQIIRLGRFTARERILDLIIELYERLSLAGVADSDGFAFPLTQEIMADALGLTSVHVNRMVQQSRRLGELCWTGGQITLPDLPALRRAIDRSTTTIRPWSASPFVPGAR